MNLETLSPITWVSGKGGVGKSLVAASIALRLHNMGRRVLLVELGDESHFQRLFKEKSSPRSIHAPQRSSQGFDYVLWSGESCLREYILYFVKLESVVNLFFENKIMKSFVEVAPAVKELAITGKATSGPRKIGPPLPYDHIVIDSYATGHMLALLRAPVGMNEAVGGGPMGRESRRILDVLKNPQLTHFVLVTLPEDLPVQEVIELKRQIEEILPEQKPEVLLNKSWSAAVDFDGWSEKDQNSEFAQYLKWQISRDEKALLDLSSASIKPQKIPYFFESDAQVVLSQMGSAL